MPYQYNGKELNEDFGLGLSDYGARWYDASLGRWWSVDPLSEMYSAQNSYHYGMNSPMMYIDPDGMGIIPTQEPPKPQSSGETIGGSIIGSNSYMGPGGGQPDDWYKSSTGETAFFDNKSKSFSDNNGVTWTNISDKDGYVYFKVGDRFWLGNPNGEVEVSLSTVDITLDGYLKRTLGATWYLSKNNTKDNPYSPWMGPDYIGLQITIDGTYTWGPGTVQGSRSFGILLPYAASDHKIRLFNSINVTPGVTMSTLRRIIPSSGISFQLFASNYYQEKPENIPASDKINSFTQASVGGGLNVGRFGIGYSKSFDYNSQKFSDSGFKTYSFSFSPLGSRKSGGIGAGISHTSWGWWSINR
jgi:RHS repeat-associated protein